MADSTSNRQQPKSVPAKSLTEVSHKHEWRYKRLELAYGQTYLRPMGYICKTCRETTMVLEGQPIDSVGIMKGDEDD